MLQVSVLFFEDSLPSLYWLAISVGGEELKWRQLAHHQEEWSLYSDISDVVITSVYSEKTRLKKLMIIIIMNTFQEITAF